ncbi:hypothetical protein [Parapedobacter tibetensis]|uniref:hypothetical protein n=1 Tax=Parapedobacter tibetensis TaxID=2972951 RepID=UPI00214DCD80|nr:hypothetical protein [Parapedobacter tibetensis]
MKEKQAEEHMDGVKNMKGIFFLLGAVFGALTGGVTQETFMATIVGAIIGLLFAAFFANILLKGREHDR